MIIEKPQKIDTHTVGCIMTYKRKYLHLKRVKDGVWGSPAGSVEDGETPEQAIIREIKEELGLDIKPVFWKTTYHNFNNNEGTVAYHMFEYDFKEDPSDMIVLDEKEAEEFVLLPIKETLKLNLFEDEDYVLKLHHKENQKKQDKQ